ncbi:uncharacterized protein LOC125849530 [Solanum stenotomum]|uniref:uncharacterized protein LOC125849530 n=1 Tax=Solanum stenotomum TaxID=172797 RepID=UPI0020D03E25|nr:uncharacterized protein LOC125849530 [Solanum stenotomum]
MTPNELNYSPIEKLCLALVFSIQKMKHYFQAHVVRLISRANPIKLAGSSSPFYSTNRQIEFPIAKLAWSRSRHTVTFGELKAHSASRRVAFGELQRVQFLILPLERQIPFLRLSIQEVLIGEENARLRLAKLEAFDEKRLESQQNLECYQDHLSRAFNKKVRLRCIQVGDKVLAVGRAIITSHKSGRKFTSKWDCPYVIQEAYSNGAYKIVNADGVRISPINVKFLKRYYP